MAVEIHVGRRLFVTMAVDRYQYLSEDAQQAGASSDAARFAGLLTDFGYEQALPGLGTYWAADQVRRALSEWSKDAQLGPQDVLVFYYAGHGLVEERDRHYLMCWDSREGDPAATALASEDLLRILMRTGLGNLLVILDTCYGAAGAADGAGVVLRTVARQFNDAGTGGVWLLSSARVKDEAVEGEFIDALYAALREVAERTGQRQQYLDLVDVVDEINRTLAERGAWQRAELAAGMVTGLAPFLDNSNFVPHLPREDTDLEQQRLLVRRDLYDHFGPRSRGVEFDAEPGLYFHGRERALEHLVGWLTAERGDSRGRIVTGSPGCGKSAVVGRIVAMSDPTYRRVLVHEDEPAAGKVPARLVDSAVHARHKLLPQIVDQIAAELGMEVDGAGQLLREIGQMARRRDRVVIVVDALDEAGSGTSADSGGKGEPRRIARELLRPLSEIPGVRLLVGTRAELVDSLGSAMRVLDLDDLAYLGTDDIAGYVTKVLLAENEPDVRTPYRGRPETARLVGAAVADRAAGVFLVARMTARGLRSADEPIDTSKPGWRDELPSEIGEAFEDYLTRFGVDESRVRSLLTPLAFAEGQGLPRTLWPQLASGLASTPFGENDVDWLLDKAGAYIAEVTDHGRSVYRLYHQALAEHLRRTCRLKAREAQSRVIDGLLASVPGATDGELDWLSAHPYVRAHLATHAVGAGRLDELVSDPAFLLAAEQLALLRAFPHVGCEAARLARNAYEQSAHRLGESAPLAERASYLQLAARRCDAGTLADEINALSLPMPWQTSWAWWSPTGVHRQLVGHQSAVNALAIGDLDDRLIVLTGSRDGEVRIWDLMTQKELGAPIKLDDRSVTALAAGDLGAYSVAVTGDDSAELRIWDLSTGQPLGEPLVGHTNRITAIELAGCAGGTRAISASRDGTARVWDLQSGTPLGTPFVKHRSAVMAVAVYDLDGQTVALTGGADNRVHIWNIDTAELVGDPLIGHTAAVNAVAVTCMGDQEVIVTGSQDGTLGLWDLRSRQQIGEPLGAHERGVGSVTVGRLNGIPIAVSCGQQIAKVWNLDTRQQLGQPLTGHSGFISAVALASGTERPVAITASSDRTARIWDLTAEQPLTGHTATVNCAAIARIGGESIAVTGSDDTTAVVWDIEGGRQIGPPLTGHRSAVAAVVLGEINGHPIAIAGGEDGALLAWDLDRRACLWSPVIGHTGAISALHLRRVFGMLLLVTGSRDGTVGLWDAASGAAVGPALAGHNADVELLALVEVDDQQFVVAAAKQGGATMWRLGTRHQVELEPPPERWWGTVAVGEVNGRAAALLASRDNALLAWDLLHGRPIGVPMVGHTDQVRQAVLTEHHGRPIAITSSQDGTMRAWDLRESQPVGHPLVGERFAPPALAVCATDSDTIVIAVNREHVRLFSLASFHQLGEALTGHQHALSAISLTAGDQPFLLCPGTDNTVRLRDLDTGKLAGPVLGGSYGLVANAAYMDLDQPTVITCTQGDNTIRAWDLTTRRERRRWAHTEDVDNVVVAKQNGGTILVTTAGADVQIWDPHTGALLHELAGHTASILDACTIEFDHRSLLLTGAMDSTAMLWDLETLECVGDALTEHEHDVNAVAMSAAGGQLMLFTGDDGGVVRTWSADGALVGSSIPQHPEWIATLTCGELHERPVLVIGGADGSIRVWCRQTERIVMRTLLSAMPAGAVIHAPESLYVATDMGIVKLNVRNWTNGASP